LNDEFLGEILDGEVRVGSLNKYGDGEGDGERSEMEMRRKKR
jgi:hypothetical protein